MWYGSQYIKTGVVPFLDTYPAYAAYSLRQLRTGVTNVVRVRRSSDNTESDFTAAQVTDGTLTTWVGANNGFVRTWYDQSGNGYNIGNTTAANQPQIVSSGSLILENGKPSVSFLSGAITWLVSPTTAPQPSADRSYLAAYVHKGNKLGSGFTTQICHTNSAANYYNGLIDRSSASRIIGTSVYDGANFTESNTDTPATDEKVIYQGYVESAVRTRFWKNATEIHNQAHTRVAENGVSRLILIGSSNSNGRLIANYYEAIIWMTNRYSDREGIRGNINGYYSMY